MSDEDQDKITTWLQTHPVTKIGPMVGVRKVKRRKLAKKGKTRSRGKYRPRKNHLDREYEAIMGPK